MHFCYLHNSAFVFLLHWVVAGFTGWEEGEKTEKREERQEEKEERRGGK